MVLPSSDRRKTKSRQAATPRVKNDDLENQKVIVPRQPKDPAVEEALKSLTKRMRREGLFLPYKLSITAEGKILAQVDKEVYRKPKYRKPKRAAADHRAAIADNNQNPANGSDLSSLEFHIDAIAQVGPPEKRSKAATLLRRVAKAIERGEVEPIEALIARVGIEATKLRNQPYRYEAGAKTTAKGSRRPAAELSKRELKKRNERAAARKAKSRAKAAPHPL